MKLIWLSFTKAQQTSESEAGELTSDLHIVYLIGFIRSNVRTIPWQKKLVKVSLYEEKKMIFCKVYSNWTDFNHSVLLYSTTLHTVVYIALVDRSTVQLRSLRAQVSFHCNIHGRRNEVTIVTGYLRWGQGDPEALLHPLSQLDPESRGQQRVRSHSLWATTQHYSKSSNHSCEMAL